MNTAWNVANFRAGLIAALRAEGFAVTAYAPKDAYVPAVELLGARFVAMTLDNARTNPVLELGTLMRMLLLLRREKPALLLTFTPKVNIYLCLAASVLDVPVIVNVSGLGWTFIAGGWLTRVTRLLYRVALSWPRKVFFQNPEDLDAFIEADLVRRERTALLPGSGVNVDRFSPRTRRPDGRFVFLMAARLLWDKGVREYVDAARMLRSEFPDAVFRLVGFLDVASPSAVPRAEVEAWQREGVIDYPGHADDMVPLYAEADCVVLPSRYREGMPRTLLEAAAMGLPVCTTDAPGCRHAIRDGETGFLCRPRDAESLAEAMRRVLRLTPEARRAMGEAARSLAVRTFDERIVTGRYLDAVREVLRERQR